MTGNRLLPKLLLPIFALLNTFSAWAQNDIQSEAEKADNVSQNIVVLRALDKITARITEIELMIGQEAKFGTLILSAQYCRTRPPIEQPETFAYLEIDDVKRNETRERVFEGWMVASSPALNPLEHSVYDVWVINCKTSSPDTEERRS